MRNAYSLLYNFSFGLVLTTKLWNPPATLSQSHSILVTVSQWWVTVNCKWLTLPKWWSVEFNRVTIRSYDHEGMRLVTRPNVECWVGRCNCGWSSTHWDTETLAIWPACRGKMPVLLVTSTYSQHINKTLTQEIDCNTNPRPKVD